MAYSKETNRFVNSLVNCNAKYDRLAEQYVLDIDDLASFELEQFARLIMLDDLDRAREATSCDNPKYDSMLASLTLHLKNTSCKYSLENFAEQWASGIISYLRPEMISLIENSLLEYNQEYAA